jgi:hypothetical protein
MTTPETVSTMFACTNEEIEKKHGDTPAITACQCWASEILNSGYHECDGMSASTICKFRADATVTLKIKIRE